MFSLEKSAPTPSHLRDMRPPRTDIDVSLSRCHIMFKRIEALADQTRVILAKTSTSLDFLYPQ